MPRVASQPRAQAPSLQRQGSVTIPLNDDRQEKAMRFQSRQPRHAMTLDQIKGGATPVRRLNNYDRAVSNSPRTPTKALGKPRQRDSDDEELIAVVPGNSQTPIKRVPILANFEEWMKMATDNKINATNSWNFALIDYFHDMSLLKEGDGVNFQKASCTLDGCVKIYTSRVDSVATETGKLLSGLADSGNRKGQQADGENEAEGSDEEGEDGTKKRTRKRAQRSEATLVPNFAALQLKKFELEFAVDPLFKKASADFDEGGAKGLLLNHLAIDAEGRIVFDSCDDVDEEQQDEDEPQPDPSMSQQAGDSESQDIDIEALGARFFPNLDLLAEQDICPSLKELDLGDPGASLDIPALKDMAMPQDDGQSPDDDDAGDGLAGFGGDDDFQPMTEAGFGEGGEAWAQNEMLETRVGGHGQAFDGEGNGGGDGGFAQDEDVFRIAMMHDQRSNDHDNILSYFDQSLKKNWVGPEHWKIRKIKDVSKAATTTPARRKEKEPFEIDFLAPLSLAVAESIYTGASSNSALSMPKAQWKARSRNLLPDDKHFNSKQLLRLFLKPKAQVRSTRQGSGYGGQGQQAGPNGDIDEAYWARQDSTALHGEESDSRDRYDADFFQDDGLAFAGGMPDDDDEFADARETFSPEVEGVTQALDATVTAGDRRGFGTQLVTSSNRVRPEYVQYARVAKKVDVRRLKEEMWKTLALEATQPPEQEPSVVDADGDTTVVQKPQPTPLKFTSVINGLQSSYSKQAMADISTSFCFISLLHLANEKGLTLGNEEGLEELSISKDMAAPPVEAAA